jgi:tetratricopeptide (TPR) repeat protein
MSTVQRLSCPLLLLIVVAIGCKDQDPAPAPSPATPAPQTSRVIVDYPLDGSVFPPEFVPPTILWHESGSGISSWKVTVTFADGGAPVEVVTDGPPPAEGEIDLKALGPTNEVYVPTEYQASARTFTPDPDLWAEVQRRSTEAEATLSIVGVGALQAEAGTVTFKTSEDPVGAPIFYRDVPLMPGPGSTGEIKPLSPNAVPLIAWRLRDVSRPESRVVLKGMPTCANCHSFSRDGNTLGMDVDGPQGDKGAYTIAALSPKTVIEKDEVITWNSFEGKPEGHKTIGFLSRISPDGSYAMTTLNESLYVSNFTNYKFLQVFYPTGGILAWYSRETGEMKALPGADDTEFVHCDPAWTPDGKTLVFARARAFPPMVPGQKLAEYAGDPKEPRIQYDLYRIPFNDGKGGEAVAIEGASKNGMSNTFPKVSPDGKWVVYTQCENGQLMRPDGRLWIVPLVGGEPREMRCNTSLMNSWHSFSPNGRWMVFSSKVNTPYTEMHLTHIDEDGNDTPPILIPNSTAANRAVNIPEFVNRNYDAFLEIEIPAVGHYRALQQAHELLPQGRFEEAAAILEEALEREPDFVRGLVALGYAHLEMGQGEKAKEYLTRAIEVDPRSSDAYTNLGLALLREEKAEEAVVQLRKAVELDTQSFQAHHNLGLALAANREMRESLLSLREAARLAPGNASIHSDLGFLLHQMARHEAAIGEYRRALQIDPSHSHARGNLDTALSELSRIESTLAGQRKAHRENPQDVEAAQKLIQTLVQHGRLTEALPLMEARMKADPNDLDTRLNLAWILATQDDSTLRDGRRAVLLAEEVWEKVGDVPRVLDVLAATYAEVGRFEDAVRAAELALNLSKHEKGVVAPGIEKRIARYRSGMPFRE